MSEQEIYDGLLNWLKQGWYAMTESEELMPLIKATFTPEEAALLTDFPYKGNYLEDLAALKKMPVEELGQQLDELARKGLLFKIVREGRVRYSLNDLFFIESLLSYTRQKFSSHQICEQHHAIPRICD